MSAPRTQAVAKSKNAPTKAVAATTARSTSKRPSKSTTTQTAKSNSPNTQNKSLRPGSAPSKSSTAQASKPKAAEPQHASNWINRTVQGYVGSAGNYAGSLVYDVGNSINQAGERLGGSIANTTRIWGEGVASYSNDIKDAVGAGGPRVATAGNPLGLAGAGQGKAVSSSRTAKKSSTKGSASNPLGI